MAHCYQPDYFASVFTQALSFHEKPAVHSGSSAKGSGKSCLCCNEKATFTGKQFENTPHPDGRLQGEEATPDQAAPFGCPSQIRLQQHRAGWCHLVKVQGGKVFVALCAEPWYGDGKMNK